MEGEEKLFDEEHSQLDADIVAKKLFLPSSDKYLVEEVLRLIFKAFLVTTKRLLVDHLPGGEFHSVTDQKKQLQFQRLTLTQTEILLYYHHLMSQKSNASYIALEAAILYSHNNKTSVWLDTKTAKEKEWLLQASRTLTSGHRINFKRRREETSSD